MDDPTNFEQLIQFRAPSNLSKAIDGAASQRCQSRSDYIRQALVDRLQAYEGSPVGEQRDGLRVGPKPPFDRAVFPDGVFDAGGGK